MTLRQMPIRRCCYFALAAANILLNEVKKFMNQARPKHGQWNGVSNGLAERGDLPLPSSHQAKQGEQKQKRAATSYDWRALAGELALP